MDALELLPVVQRIATSGVFVFFITIGSNGPRSRLVTHLALDDDFTIWFMTNLTSSKLLELQADPRCAYSIEDRSSLAYVTFAGTAQTVNRSERTAELWDKWGPALEPLWPGGPDDPDYVAINVVPNTIELNVFGENINPGNVGGSWRLTLSDDAWVVSTTSG